MTYDELSAQLRSLAPNETLDVRDDLLATLLPDRSDGYRSFASERECQVDAAPVEEATRFVKVARESISERDRAAIDRFYEYAGYGYFGLGWYSDVDRRDHMDFKDRVRRRGQEELRGIGAMAVAAAKRVTNSTKKWRTHRTLIAYGRIFMFDRKGAVIDATRIVDPMLDSATA